MNQDERSTVLPVLPLDDAVVLPGTSVTFPVTSDEQAEALNGAVEGRILLVPRIDGRFGSFGVVASVVGEVTLPDGTRGVAVEALHRAELGPAVSAEVGLKVSAIERPDPVDAGPEAAALAREYRAVVEEVAALRGDRAQVARFLAGIAHPGRLADTTGYAPEVPLTTKITLLETVDVAARLRLAIEAQRERLADAGLRQRIREDVSENLDKTQREMLLRRQLAAIRKELGEDDEAGDDWADRIAGSGHARGRPQGGRARARPPGAPARRRRGRDDPHLPGVDGLAALGHALGRAPGRGRGPRGPRRGPRRPGDGQGAHPRVPGGPAPAPRARHGRRQERGHPDPGRPARHRQDVARPVRGPRPGARVRAHQPGRHPRRGRDPRPPAHLRRRPAGAAGPRAARGRHAQPGGDARRDRQGRQRLARRPVVGAARGARPGPEPQLPRPLPGRGAGPVRGPVHRHRQRRGHHPRAAPGPHGGHRARRLHRAREAGDRPRLPGAPPDRAQRPARGRGRDQRRGPRAGSSPTTPARRACAAWSARSASSCARRRGASPRGPTPRSRSARATWTRPWGSRASTTRRRSARRRRASPPASR